MKPQALIIIVLVLVFSAFAQENEIKDEALHPNTYFGHYGGIGGGSGGGAGGTGGGAGGSAGGAGSTGGGAGSGGGGAGSYSGGISHGGVYGGGKVCKWGCCSKSYGYSHAGGGYYTCTCCATPAQAKAYQLHSAHNN